MAKKDESPKITRKIAARHERDRAQSRQILYLSLAVVALVIVLVLAGFIYDRVIIPRQPVAVVRGDNISTSEFQTRVRYERYQLVNRYYNTLQTLQLFGSDPQTQSFFLNSVNQIEFQLEPSSLGRTVLNILIEDKLIRQEAVNREITVSEDEINARTEEFFGYYEGGYVPTATLVPTTLPTSTLSPEQLALITPTPTKIITATAVPTSPPEPTGTSSAPTPTPYTFDAFQQQYKDTLDTLQRDIRFSENALKNLVESQVFREKMQDDITKNLPRTQEQVWARHILVENEEQAQNALARLNDGEDFGLLAQELSTDQGSATKGGDLGWFPKGVMAPEFETEAFQLAIGEVSPPIETQFGWHIIQVLGHEDRSLSASAYEQAKQEAFQEWLTKLRDDNDAEIITNDIWSDRTPTEPSIPEGYTDAFMAQLNAQNATAEPTQETTPTP